MCMRGETPSLSIPLHRKGRGEGRPEGTTQDVRGGVSVHMFSGHG